MPPQSLPAPARAPGGVAERIWQFNQGRRPDTLALKFRKMSKNGFAFFRGTCHLFYQNWSPPAALAGAPLTWVSGDLHLENFGAYPGENGLAYFNVNDFDEAAVAPLAWDLVRFVASLFTGLATLGRPSAEAAELARQHFLEAYVEALSVGAARPVDAALQPGPVGDIMRALPSHSGAGYLDALTEQTSSGRRLKAGQDRLLPIADGERLQITQLVEDFGRQRQAGKSFRVLDVARLVAGTSSLGLDRYAVLTQGEGPPNGNRVLEIKEVRGSCLGPYLTWPQPAWPGEAARVVAAQVRFQEVPPALLGATGAAGKAYLIRDLSVGHDRLNLADPGWTERRLAPSVRTMAQVAAHGHRRGCAGQGASETEALTAFAHETAWRAPLIQYAQQCAAQSEADYYEYSAAYDRGELALAT
jgi:uncharacterized protein (DUF2252 family)